MAYNPRDFYFKKAKEKNFAARSIFKLEEIDQRFKILKTGQKVLDLGCAPGSWSQYASMRVGAQGKVVGLDLKKPTFYLPNVQFIEGDVFLDSIFLDLASFDIVLSDMAPKTTGVRVVDQERSFELSYRAFEIAKLKLKPSGRFIVKLFHSSYFEKFLRELRQTFKKVEVLRPQSTRRTSVEIYLIGLNKY